MQKHTIAERERERERIYKNRKDCPRVVLSETKLNLLIVNQKAHLRLKNTKQKHQQSQIIVEIKFYRKGRSLAMKLKFKHFIFLFRICNTTIVVSPHWCLIVFVGVFIMKEFFLMSCDRSLFCRFFFFFVSSVQEDNNGK